MCLKLSKTAKRIPLASLLPWPSQIWLFQPVLQADLETHITSHQNRPEEDSEHESIVLEMYVVYNEEPRVKE